MGVMLVQPQSGQTNLGEEMSERLKTAETQNTGISHVPDVLIRCQRHFENVVYGMQILKNP